MPSPPAGDTVTIDMTEGYEDLPSRQLWVRLVVPVVPEHRAGPLRVSLDYCLEQIRARMRQGLASKEDEDNLVIFRLLQAFGYAFWPPEEEA